MHKADKISNIVVPSNDLRVIPLQNSTSVIDRLIQMEDNSSIV